MRFAGASNLVQGYKPPKDRVVSLTEYSIWSDHDFTVFVVEAPG